MVGNKRGMVMVYVLVFLLFSQLIYWGILRINQVNSQRYADFQDHYRASVQENMVLNLFQGVHEENTKLLEGYIQERIDRYYQGMVKAKEGEWTEVQPNLYLLYYQQEDREVAQFFVADVYMSVELIDYCLAFEDQSCSGYIHTDNTTKLFSSTQAQYYREDQASSLQVIEEVQHWLEDLGYQFIDYKHDQIRLNWQSPQHLDLVVGTNYGTSYYQMTSIHSTLHTVINGRAFDRTIKTNAYDNRLIIGWKSFQFEKTSQD